MIEYDGEPTPGLPGALPPGERILWQGGPDARTLARTAFHTRLIGGYFALLAGGALASALVGGAGLLGALTGAATTILVGAAAVALLHLLAWGSARTTIYTLTDRRLVLRLGIAVPKCVNVPLAMIESVDLARGADGTGDLPLKLLGEPKLGYLALWPHARAWRVVRPEPMLRAVPDAERLAVLIARACGAGQVAAVEAQAVRPMMVAA